MYQLENWSLTYRQEDPYRAPETKLCLHGNVYGHPSFERGSEITTSAISSVDAEAGTVTTTSGSVYELGEVDPAYEAQFPNARERLFKEQ